MELSPQIVRALIGKLDRVAVASATGSHPTTVSHWKLGRRSVSLVEAEKIAALAGLTFDLRPIHPEDPDAGKLLAELEADARVWSHD